MTTLSAPARFALAATLGMAFGATAPVVAHAAEGMMARIADGAPWAMRAPNGRTMNVTLNPDGTGTVRMGPIRAMAEWRATEDGFCLTTIRTGERCMVIEEGLEGGFVGRGPDGAVQFAR